MPPLRGVYIRSNCLSLEPGYRLVNLSSAQWVFLESWQGEDDSRFSLSLEPFTVHEPQVDSVRASEAFCMAAALPLPPPTNSQERSKAILEWSPDRLAMDWGALGSRDAVLATCEHFCIDGRATTCSRGSCTRRKWGGG
jgi:hypothetical protein